MRGRTQDASVGSSQLIRRLNAQRVLQQMWHSEPTTASELMEVTGLTRATVLALCRELADHGWLQVLENARQAGTYTKGRPALRYAFRQNACYVVGVDAGQHRISASVADLRGCEIGYAQRALQPRLHDPDQHTGAERQQEIRAIVDAALEQAAVAAADVGSMVIGVPAPVDVEGRSPEGLNRFWGRMNPGLVSMGAEYGWDCAVENDANLAALAELNSGPTAEDSSFAVLLSGERLGSGIVVSGALWRQPRGSAGELGMLELVNGVESTMGLGWWARHLAQDAIRAGAAEGSLSGLRADEVQAEQVFAAASRGEAVALEIIDELADRLARICVVLTGLLDLDRIVVSGAVAPALAGVVASAKEKLSAYMYAPWLDIATSSLGEEAVRIGAVASAVERVQERALDGEPAERKMGQGSMATS